MLLIILLFLLVYFIYIHKYKHKNYIYKINYKTLNIIKKFFNHKTINIITLLGNNIKSKYKYIKYIAKLYNKKIINCNLHALHNTNDLKELLFHKKKFVINEKHFNININKRLFVFNNINYFEYNEYVSEIENIIILLNFFSYKTKFVFIFIINTNNIINNTNNNILYISLNKNSYNYIRYFHNNKFKLFYYSQ